MSNDIAVYKLSDMQVMADAVARSGLFGMKSPEQALALMLVAQAEGQHPATITQDYDIIQGKACRKTHSVMARFQQMGGTVEWHVLTESMADATFSHPSGGSLRISWTIEQARKIGLTNKDNWKNYPRAMLRARVIAEGVRAVYPAAIGGMMIAEEASDAPPDVVRDMGAAEVERPAAPGVEMPRAKSAPIDVTPTKEAETSAAKNGVQAENTDGAAQQNKAGTALNTSMLKVVRATAKNKGVTEAELCAHFKAESLEALTVDVNTVLAWLSNPGA